MKEPLEEIVEKVEASKFLTACKNCKCQFSVYDFDIGKALKEGKEKEEIDSWML